MLMQVRTHLGANDSAYSCIFQTEDEVGTVGVRLSKELMAVAGGCDVMRAAVVRMFSS